MIIYPAIDLMGGRCVRLTRGRFDTAVDYGADPVGVAQRYQAAGATHLHVVDLDGARGRARQTQAVCAIARATDLFVQAGGGVRSASHARELFDGGVQRVVVGSLAVQEPQQTRDLLCALGAERFVLALDVRIEATREARVATQGWQETSALTPEEVLARYAEIGRPAVLATDIGRDGTLDGPNAALYRRLTESAPGHEILASGGVASLADLRAVRATGVAGVVVGKALYEGRFSLAEALAC